MPAHVHLIPRPRPTTPCRATRGHACRVVRLRLDLVVRREIARDGYVLRFTGKEATSAMLDEVLDDIERMYTKE
jgi:ParB family chromosome partitioning protein